jgi:hypothetical protein
MSSCSKAPRGLFVLLRTDGIFTANALSPSSSLRQCPNHYAIRAGQNLPDKEFRYLRTVIVTAAVHRGFSSKREPLALTFRHRAGVTPYTSTFVLAESYVFGKQLLGLLSCGQAMPYYLQNYPCNDLIFDLFLPIATKHHIHVFGSTMTRPGRPYPEVTVAVLPSSLTKIHSYALVFST